MKLELLTWEAVENYLTNKDELIIPIGSVEQHGPTGLIGTDFLTATDIANAVGDKQNILVAPAINYGMAAHHMGFPGTATLRPKTLIDVIYDVVSSFYKHGFRKILFINGHGGNIAIINSAFCELKYTEDFQGLDLKLKNWWQLSSVKNYEDTNFGNESGFHATIGEVSVTQYNQKEAFLNIPSTHFKIERPTTIFPLTATEMRNAYPDGRMSSNPGHSSYEHGEKIFNLAVDEICKAW